MILKDETENGVHDGTNGLKADVLLHDLVCTVLGILNSFRRGAMNDIFFH